MEETKLSYYFDDLDAFPFSEILIDLDHLENYFAEKEKIVQSFKKDVRIDLGQHVSVRGEVVIGEGTTVDPYVVIEGPIYIGKNVTIRSGALIRPGSIIGDNAVIGHGVEVKNVHTARGAKMSSHAFVGDSILGKGARMGGGAETGNRRFDQAEISLKIKDAVISTGMDKFGAILGDYVRLGAQTITSPGTVVGKNTWVYGNTSLAGFVPKQSLVKLRQTIEIVEKEGEHILKDVDQEGKI